MHSKYQFARTVEAIDWWRDSIRDRSGHPCLDDFSECGSIVAVAVVFFVRCGRFRLLSMAGQNLSGVGFAQFAQFNWQDRKD